MFIPLYSVDFKKKYKKLPLRYQKKFIKQLAFLLQNPRHPSLKSRKMGSIEKYEARLDDHYRFTYMVESTDIFLLTIGPHDAGLGKK